MWHHTNYAVFHLTFVWEIYIISRTSNMLHYTIVGYSIGQESGPYYRQDINIMSSRIDRKQTAYTAVFITVRE